MSGTTNARVILARMLPESTRSMSGVGEPGQSDEKWTNGTRQRWTRAENMELLNTTILVIPVRGATRRGCGIHGSFETQHQA